MRGTAAGALGVLVGGGGVLGPERLHSLRTRPFGRGTLCSHPRPRGCSGPSAIPKHPAPDKALLPVCTSAVQNCCSQRPGSGCIHTLSAQLGRGQAQSRTRVCSTRPGGGGGAGAASKPLHEPTMAHALGGDGQPDSWPCRACAKAKCPCGFGEH